MSSTTQINYEYYLVLKHQVKYVSLKCVFVMKGLTQNIKKVMENLIKRIRDSLSLSWEQAQTRQCSTSHQVKRQRRQILINALKYAHTLINTSKCTHTQISLCYHTFQIPSLHTPPTQSTHDAWKLRKLIFTLRLPPFQSSPPSHLIIIPVNHLRDKAEKSATKANKA